VPAVLNSGPNRTWAPAGLAVYKGTALAPWRGNLFFGTLRGQHLHRVVLASDGTVQSDEELFANQYGRIRAVVEGPDGYIYFSTSNRDGRGSPAAEDDRILRIVPGS
jgi:aldose sugar dehydrogenase